MIVTAPWVSALLGAHGLVLAGAVGYLRASAAGLPFLYLSYAGNGHLIGLADTRTPLGIAVATNAANVVLEVILVYGAHLGLLGLAWGTVAAQVAEAALYARAAGKAPVRPRRPGQSEIAALLRDGHRLSVRTVALGGQQIAMRVWLLLALLLDALAVPAQVYVSAALGGGDPAGAHRVGRRTLRLGLIAGVGLGVLTAALAPWIPTLFTADPAVRHAAAVALLVAALPQPVRRHSGDCGIAIEPARAEAGRRQGRAPVEYGGDRRMIGTWAAGRSSQATTPGVAARAAGYGHRPGRITVHRVPDHLSV